MGRAPGILVLTLASVAGGVGTALAMPRGPVTGWQVIAAMLVGAVVGAVSGYAVRSRWAIVAAPAVFVAACELSRIGGGRIDGRPAQRRHELRGPRARPRSGVSGGRPAAADDGGRRHGRRSCSPRGRPGAEAEGLAPLDAVDPPRRGRPAGGWARGPGGPAHAAGKHRPDRRRSRHSGHRRRCRTRPRAPRRARPDRAHPRSQRHRPGAALPGRRPGAKRPGLHPGVHDRAGERCRLGGMGPAGHRHVLLGPRPHGRDDAAPGCRRHDRARRVPSHPFREGTDLPVRQLVGLDPWRACGGAAAGPLPCLHRGGPDGQ